jgi:hypothetical protein
MTASLVRPNISALARQHAVSRQTIRRRLAKGWQPPQQLRVHDQRGIVEVLPPCPAAARRWPGVAVALIAISIGIAVLALAINGQTGWRFGTTPLASITFAGLSLAGDLLAIVLPSAAVALWHGRRPLLATAAWTTWTVAAALAWMASLGFAELHISDTAAGRRDIVATSVAVADQRKASVAAAQLAATAATKAREGECMKRGPLCREREAEQRQALATLSATIAAPVSSVATIADADPQVTAALRLAIWTGLKLTTNDVVNLRLVLMALMPNIAGLVLAFGVALRGSVKR